MTIKLDKEKLNTLFKEKTGSKVNTYDFMEESRTQGVAIGRSKVTFALREKNDELMIEVREIENIPITNRMVFLGDCRVTIPSIDDANSPILYPDDLCDPDDPEGYDCEELVQTLKDVNYSLDNIDLSGITLDCSGSFPTQQLLHIPIKKGANLEERIVEKVIEKSRDYINEIKSLILET